MTKLVDFIDNLGFVGDSRVNWTKKCVFSELPDYSSTWYTHLSHIWLSKRFKTGSGRFSMATLNTPSYGSYATVFQTENFTILALISFLLYIETPGIISSICSDSRDVLKALVATRTNSKLVYMSVS